eukprot:scaffold222332_cov18-Tisochrysis_lutea.AAC.1
MPKIRDEPWQSTCTHLTFYKRGSTEASESIFLKWQEKNVLQAMLKIDEASPAWGNNTPFL